MTDLILHIPHASLRFPDTEGFFISRDAIQAEALKLTDLYTDELFAGEPNDIVVAADFCRVYCDVERFQDDNLEPMSQFGMGAVYTKTEAGQALRRITPKQKDNILQQFYVPHHQRLTEACNRHLKEQNRCMIVDCHSFPNEAFRTSLQQGNEKFDFNIGTDWYHTPEDLTEASKDYFETLGYNLGIDTPYSGTIVPMSHFRTEKRVSSIMLEVNRRLYLDENFCRTQNFESIKNVVSGFLRLMREVG